MLAARVGAALTQAGQTEKAAEMYTKLHECQSYDEALHLLTSYIEASSRIGGRMSPNESLLNLRQIAEGFLRDTQTTSALDVAMHEATISGCTPEVIRHVCEVALERVIAAHASMNDTP